MTNNIRLAIILCFALAVSGCSGGGQRDEQRGAEVSALAEAPAELALPTVPDSLTTIEERAGFVVQHFWDSMDFADTSLSLDTAFVEQNFVNFLSIIPAATEADAEEAFVGLLRRAAAEPAALALLRSTAVDYLDNPNSPMRDEGIYIMYMHALLASGLLDEADTARTAYRLECAMKNRPGSKATDFRFALRGGGETNLLKAVADAEATLLIFYDPDCEHCKEIMGAVANVCLRPGAKIVAVDAEADRAAWERTAPSLPDGWTVGYAVTPILDEELYTLPASPTMYLIGRDGTVIAKDADPGVAIEFVAAR